MLSRFSKFVSDLQDRLDATPPKVILKYMLIGMAGIAVLGILTSAINGSL